MTWLLAGTPGDGRTQVQNH